MEMETQKKLEYNPVSIGDEIQVSETYGYDAGFLTTAVKLCIVLLGGFGTVFSFFDSFEFAFSGILLFVGGLGVLFLLYHFIYYRQADKMQVMLGVVVYLVILFLQKSMIEKAIDYCVNRINTAYNSYFNTTLSIKVLNPFEESGIITLFAFDILILYLFILMLATWRKVNYIVHVVITVPPVILCFVLGIVPSGLPFTMLITYYFGILGLSTMNSWRYGISERKRHFRKKNYHIIQGEEMGSYTSILSSAILGGAVLLGFCIPYLFIDPRNYETPSYLESMKEHVVQVMDMVSLNDIKNDWTNIFDILGTDVASGGVSGGKLGDVDQIIYKNDTALAVTVPDRSYGYYLRGFVGGVYTGNSWEPINPDDYNSADDFLEGAEDGLQTIQNLNFTALDYNFNSMYYVTKEKFSLLNMKVVNINANSDYVYTPYNADYSEFGSLQYPYDGVISGDDTKSELYQFYHFDSDGSISGIVKNNGTYPFVPQTEEEVKPLQDFLALEDNYRNYVYDVYTDLPEDRLSRFKKEFSSIVLYDSNNNEYDLSENPDAYKTIGWKPYIQYVKNYLSSHASYTLSPGKLQKGKDFVEDFLFDKKEGYCTYFASAGTLMFRAMGIPARYVEGYVVRQEDYDNGKSYFTEDFSDGLEQRYITLSIPDSHAHAWVEIYQDGLGWIPVDVTPASGSSGTDSLGEDSPVSGEVQKNTSEQQTVEETTARETEQATTKQITNETEQSTQVQESVNNSENNIEGNTVTGKGTTVTIKQINEKSKIHYGYFILGILGLVLLLAFQCMRMRRSYYLKKRNNWKKEDKNQHLIRLGDYLFRILARQGISLMHYQTVSQLADQINEVYVYLQKSQIEQVLKTLQKAQYSNRTVSDEEYYAALAFVSALVNTTYEYLKIHEKFAFKYVWCFL